jgi:hypothetical protein
MEEHGWLILIAAAMMLGGMTLWEMRRLAPRFTGLQGRWAGYGMELTDFLTYLSGDPGQLERVNRARKLDLRAPAILGFIFIAVNLLFAGDPRTALICPRIVPALQVFGIGAAAIALAGDYLENIQLGRMIDALPALPDDVAVRGASRTTIVKLYGYGAAILIGVPQLLVYVFKTVF